MDLIDRQAAISDFEWCKSQAIDKDKWQEAIDRIKALPVAQRWIPVSERLPDKCVNVLVQLDGDWIEISALIGDVWQNQWGLYCPTNDVVAWMPLPEPYKESSDGE